MTHRFKALLLPLALFASVAAAQTFPVEIEAGYRWTEVDGNEALYRSQINEQDGFVIRSLSFFSTSTAFDHLRIDATDLGVGPASSVRVDAGKSGKYRARLAYRSFDSFSALPAFANPLLGQGIIPGQHTYDRSRSMFDADVEFLPGGKITPFIGYSMARNSGPGTSTYTVGGDEFLLGSDLDEDENEFRVGAGFSVGKFAGQVTQGWRSLKSKQTLSLTGPGVGNSPGSVLDRPISATTITREGRTDVDTPFTSVFVTGDVIPRVKLIGNYTSFSAEAEGDEDEAATGSFVSFALSRFFGGLSESVTSRAENNTRRGGLRAEVALRENVALLAGWQSEHRELTGSSLITTLFKNTLTFGGVDPKDIQEILETDNSIERDEDVLSAALSVRALGPLAFRVGVSSTRDNLDVAPDLSEIVVPGNQSGRFDRDIRTYDVNATYTQSLLMLGASWKRDDADSPVVRTDFNDRDRLRLRAAFSVPDDRLRAGFTVERTAQDNELGYVAKLRQYTSDIEIAPVTSLRLRASYSRLRADSSATIRRPETFVLETSVHEEDGRSVEGGIEWFFAKGSVNASYGQFENRGTLPFTVDRYRVRVVYDFLARTGLAAEWSSDKYEEAPVYGRFDAQRFGIFLRWR